jgi:hypothetical protein
MPPPLSLAVLELKMQFGDYKYYDYSFMKTAPPNIAELLLNKQLDELV